MLADIAGFADVAGRAGSAGGGHNAFNAASEVDNTVYHFSIQSDLSELLNFNHEYQIVWIEPSDRTYVFDI